MEKHNEMIRRTKDLLKVYFGNIKTVVILLTILAIILPIFVYKLYCYNFFIFYKDIHPNELGDTIGGISGVIINLIAAILVYKSFDAQIKANAMLQEQLKDERYFKLIESLREYKKDDVRTKAIENSYDCVQELIKSSDDLYNNRNKPINDIILANNNLNDKFKEHEDIINNLISLVIDIRLIIIPKTNTKEKNLFNSILDSMLTHKEQRVLDYFNERFLQEKLNNYEAKDSNRSLFLNIEDVPRVFIDVAKDVDSDVNEFLDNKFIIKSSYNPIEIVDVSIEHNRWKMNLPLGILKDKKDVEIDFNKIFDNNNKLNKQKDMKTIWSIRYKNNQFNYEFNFQLN